MKRFAELIPCVLLFAFLTAGAVCGAEHEHTFTELYTAKPTCTEKGYTVFSCDCGEAYEGRITDALGHNYTEDKVCFKEATCLERGEEGRYCLRCYAKTDVIYHEKTAHSPETVIKKATLKSNGEKRKECSVCKRLYSSKVIYKIKSVKLEKTVLTYDGKVKTPAVTVKDLKGKVLKKGTDYTVKYQKGRKKTGSYSVTVTFKGSYEGKKILYFKIRPTAVKNISASPSVTSVYLSWDKAKGADGYEIYLKTEKKSTLIKATDNPYCTVNKINGKKLGDGKSYTFIIKSFKKSGDTRIYSASKKIEVTTKPKRAGISKISVSSGRVTIKTLKQECRGFEILLSTNKSFSNPKRITVKGKTSYTFKGLSKGKKYYVKVRAYVLSGGEKYVGYYSEIKSFKA